MIKKIIRQPKRFFFASSQKKEGSHPFKTKLKEKLVPQEARHSIPKHTLLKDPKYYR
jgi:hypothetical protein